MENVDLKCLYDFIVFIIQFKIFSRASSIAYLIIAFIKRVFFFTQYKLILYLVDTYRNEICYFISISSISVS